MSDLNVEDGTMTMIIPITITVKVKEWADNYDINAPIDLPLYQLVRKDVVEYFQTETFEQLGCGQTGCIVL